MDPLTPSSLLAELERRNIQVAADGERLNLDGPAGSLTPDLRAQLIEHKPELLEHLRQQDINVQPVSMADELEQTIQQAATWGDIETALERAQVVYQAGELSAEDVERLAVQAQQKALKCPENDVQASGIIWTYELLPGPQNGFKDACLCCGKSAWWRDRYGNQKCGVCHPDPRRKER